MMTRTDNTHRMPLVVAAIVAALAVLMLAGCTQAQLQRANETKSDADAAIVKIEAALAKIAEERELAVKAGVDPEKFDKALEEGERALADAKQVSEVAGQTIAALEAGEPWYNTALKIVMGAVGAASLFVPQLRSAKAGLDGLVRLVDGVKAQAGKEVIRDVAARTINDNELPAIEAARKRQGV